MEQQVNQAAAAELHTCPVYFSPAFFRPGQRVMYGEFPATVVRHDCGGMWEVRVPGGVTCVSGAHLKVA